MSGNFRIAGLAVATLIVSGCSWFDGDKDEALEPIKLVDIETTVERVLIVGHNPTWADLVSRLIGGGDVRFPTAAVACVQLPESSWSAVGSSCGELLWFVIPRLL